MIRDGKMALLYGKTVPLYTQMDVVADVVIHVRVYVFLGLDPQERGRVMGFRKRIRYLGQKTWKHVLMNQPIHVLVRFTVLPR